MASYLDKVKEIERSIQASANTADLSSPRVAKHVVEDHGRGFANPYSHLLQPTVGCETSELSEKRAVLLGRLWAGQAWLLDQHNRWQIGDTTAADDEAFSAAWDGWGKLDFQFRAEYGLAGCIFGPSGECPGDFLCIGCTEAPTPVVVAQLALMDAR